MHDGNDCKHCEGQTGAERGHDEGIPCDECGWYRSSSSTGSGLRYPPAPRSGASFGASSWQQALRRVETLENEFSDFPEGAVLPAVIEAGADDVHGQLARKVLFIREFPDIRRDHINCITSMLHEMEGDELTKNVRSILNDALTRRKEKVPSANSEEFDKDFDLEFGEIITETYQKKMGCFNCNKRGVEQRCAKCQVAVYCNRMCQSANWKDKEMPHKEFCKVYGENRAPSEEGGENGPFPIALYSVGVVESSFFLEELMEGRADLFLEEAARAMKKLRSDDSTSIGRHNMIGLQIAVVYNMGHARLQASASLLVGWERIAVNMVIFKSVGEGEDLRRMIYPAGGGSGDLPGPVRAKVLEHLKSFLSAARERDITIFSVTCGRGTMWLAEKESEVLLKEANNNDPLHVIQSVDYVMRDMWSAVLGTGE